jgi:hypothetical protein
MHLGEYDVFRVCELTGKKTFLFSQHNEWVDTWGAIAARAIALGDRTYKLSAMYVEFENVASPGDAVTVPTIDPADGIDYYLDLASSPTRDFLRIPLDVSPVLSVVDGYDSIPDDEGNQVQLFATTQGVTGANGKTFSNGANSKIFGVALVATPEWGDRTRDIVFARSYFEVADQQLKQPSSQHTLSYRLKFILL